jgi:hypothetical protein
VFTHLLPGNALINPLHFLNYGVKNVTAEWKLLLKNFELLTDLLQGHQRMDFSFFVGRDSARLLYKFDSPVVMEMEQWRT